MTLIMEIILSEWIWYTQKKMFLREKKNLSACCWTKRGSNFKEKKRITRIVKLMSKTWYQNKNKIYNNKK